MNMKYLPKKSLFISLTLLVLLCGTQMQARGWGNDDRDDENIIGGSIKGAIIGGMLGNAFGNKKDGKKAAKIGMLIGALKAADKKEKRKKREQAYAQQQYNYNQQRLNMLNNQQSVTQPMNTAELSGKIERSLIILGYLEAPVTGVYGKTFRRAIRTYQRVNHLPVNPKPTHILLQQLIESGG